MIGHDVMLSETNTKGFIPICECGWIGNVSACGYVVPEAKRRRAMQQELARSEAIRQHATHLVECENEIAVASAEALRKHGEYLKVVTPVVTRLGRFGRG